MVFGKKFLLDVICVVFIYVEDNKMLRIVCCNLSAELRTNGTATACDENDFTGELVEDFVHVDFDGGASEQVFDFDLLNGANRHFTTGELQKAWNAK